MLKLWLLWVKRWVFIGICFVVNVFCSWVELVIGMRLLFFVCIKKVGVVVELIFSLGD